ncbi:type II secretion system protein N [Hyphomonas sp.]|uniref:type II secretion system protein N n=1 Tax=Hyphomonas sp. TaxID=87 RepID=UPI0025C62DE8|nr:type II secretion system protein N [Hyphomonas sp.]
MERSVPYARVEQAGRLAVESLLTVTAGLLLGRLAWVALAPGAAVPAPLDLAASQVPDSSLPEQALLVQINPFDGPNGLELASQTTSRETTLDLKLAGVRAVEGDTIASSAVISYPDGHQARFVPGDQVMPGVVLVNVTVDSVHLSRDGTLELLSLYPANHELFAPSTPTPETAPSMDSAALFTSADIAPAFEVTPASLAADTILTPEYRGGQVSGYRLAPRGNGAFEEAGLKAGDLILRINGQAIEGMRPDQINRTVATGTDVALDVVRQGAIVRLRVAPNASLSQ